MATETTVESAEEHIRKTLEAICGRFYAEN